MIVVLIVAVLFCLPLLPFLLLARSGRTTARIEGMTPQQYAWYGRTLEQIREQPEHDPGPLVRR